MSGLGATNGNENSNEVAGSSENRAESPAGVRVATLVSAIVPRVRCPECGDESAAPTVALSAADLQNETLGRFE